MRRSQPSSHSFVCLGVPEHGQTGGPGWIQWALAVAGSTIQWGTSYGVGSGWESVPRSGDMGSPGGGFRNG